MNDFLGWVMFLAVAWFLSKPIRDGFRSGLKEEEPAPPAGFSLEVVGESNYQAALARVAGPKGRDSVNVVVTAEVIFEESNPHDSYAVRVDVQGKTVGYLSRETARIWRKRVPSAQVTCSAVIRGGWDRGGGDQGHYGIWLKPPAGF